MFGQVFRFDDDFVLVAHRYSILFDSLLPDTFLDDNNQPSAIPASF